MVKKGALSKKIRQDALFGAVPPDLLQSKPLNRWLRPSGAVRLVRVIRQGLRRGFQRPRNSLDARGFGYWFRPAHVIEESVSKKTTNVN